MACLVVLLLLAVLGVGALAGYARWRYDQIHKLKLSALRPPAAAAAGPSGPTSENILIVGNNTRVGQKEGFFGTVQEVGGARSDVTMVLHLDLVHNTASLLSIPRDYFVPLPPHSMSGAVGKIDASLNDGPNNLVAAVTGSLGIPIDHYVELDFDGFQNVVNAIGGIPMDFPELLRDNESGLNITKTGCQKLSGAQTLALVRSRMLQYYSDGRWNYDPLSDLARIRRDQAFLRVLVSTIKDRGLNNPIEAQSVLGDIVHDISIDSGLSEGDMISWGTKFRTIDPSTVPATTLPITVVPSYHFGDGTYGDVDFPAEPQDQQVISTFLGTAQPSVTTSVTGADGRTVDVQDISGLAGTGSSVARKLAALGFTIGTVVTESSPASPTESVIRYAPGDIEPAKAVMSALNGAAVLYPDTAVPAGHIVLQVGSVIAVQSLPATPSPGTASEVASTTPSPATSPSPVRSPAEVGGSATPSSSPSPSPSPSGPTPGGQAITPPTFPVQPYDPFPCPPGVQPQ